MRDKFNLARLKRSFSSIPPISPDTASRERKIAPDGLADAVRWMEKHAVRRDREEKEEIDKLRRDLGVPEVSATDDEPLDKNAIISQLTDQLELTRTALKRNREETERTNKYIRLLEEQVGELTQEKERISEARKAECKALSTVIENLNDELNAMKERLKGLPPDCELW